MLVSHATTRAMLKFCLMYPWIYPIAKICLYGHILKFCNDKIILAKKKVFFCF